MKIMNSIKKFTAVLICAGIFAGCTGTSDNVSDTVTSGQIEDTSTESTQQNSSENITDNDKVRITALSGPTAMGMTKLMADNESGGYGYEFNIVSAVDEVSPMVIKGDTDIFCVPANLASVLYNKTEGEVQVLAVNTWSNLHLRKR